MSILLENAYIAVMSDVFFTTMRGGSRLSILDKLRKLLIAAGIDDIDFKEKFVAIKVHFGEHGNVAYIRHDYSKVIIDVVKERGGKPFLTDCSTLYSGRRQNAPFHLDLAQEHGFTPLSIGCNIIIGDGLKGNDEVIVNIDGEYVKEAKIGHAIFSSDVLIAVSHFKCHDITGFGGALKNVGMGCASKRGKMEMHSAGKPEIEHADCTNCGSCSKVCSHSAIIKEKGKTHIMKSECTGCGRCVCVCPNNCIIVKLDRANDITCRMISEYAAAAVKDKECFFVNFVMDVSPQCDCWEGNDTPVVKDIGIFASFDPVALDAACADAVNREPALKGSALDDTVHKPGESDISMLIHPRSGWRLCIEQAVLMKMGDKRYKLIEV